MTLRKFRIPSFYSIILLFICCFFVFTPSNLQGLERGETITDYLVNAYSIADGLPQNSILCLIQAEDGYIWFGTQSGLVRFDGVTPRIFNRWNTPELKNDTILTLCEEKNGYLWVGTDGGGFAGMKAGIWKSYTTNDGLSHNRIRVIFKDSKNNLWLGTDYGLNRMRDGKFKVFTTADGLAGNAIDAIAESRNGDLWVGAGSEDLNLFKNGEFQTFKVGNNEPVMEITAIHEDRSGRLWIGAENGLYLFESGKAQLYQGKNSAFTKPIRAISEDENGLLRFGTYGHGLVQLADGLFSNLTTENGFVDDFIYSLLEDYEGNLWVGTYTSGLIQMQNSRVASISRENGLPENIIYAVCPDRQGFLWAGTRGSGLCKITGNRVEKIFSIKNGLAGNRVRALHQDSDGSLWIGTEGSGLNRFKNGGFSHYTTAQGLTSNNVKVILRDRASVLWIGTDNGLSLLKNGEFNAVGGNSGLPAAHKNINVLLEESGGALLAGTKGGLIRFENGRFRPFSTANSSMDMEVLSLYEDPEKNLWIGTKGSGLICFRNGTATPITTGAGLHNNYIFSILEDNGGNLWMSSYRGVFRAAKKELLQFAAGKTKKIKSIYFDEKDGMKSSECMPAGYPAACRTSNGRICFPTVKGIAVFDPAAIRIDKKPPRVLIEDVIVDNEAVKKDDTNGIVISAEKKMLEFYFTALSFRSPERIRFKYKLEGFEKEWVETEPQQKRTAYYINLKPGAYRFRVIAGSGDGIWNTEGARFEFQIKTSFFKQPAFYILLVLALLSVAGGILRFYINKKRRTKKTKKYKTSALDAERADEILPKLLVLMEKEKIYLNADLTLKKLSERLMIHYNHLSQIINEKLQFSFNDFVNKYRIEEAKKKLLDPAEGKKTVLEIAYDTGFYSKSVFNTAFKKFTGMTPSQFKKKKR